jgi:uncharacterized membrane protein
MPALASRLAGALVVLILLVAPLAAHAALVMHRGAAIAATLIAVQAAVITWIGSSALAPRGLRIGAGAAVFLLVVTVYRFAGNGALVTIAVPHAMAYLTLLVVFAASLQPGREAVVTLLARKTRGPLSAQTLRYTRRVTWAWCWFFVAQLTASLLLLLFAPHTVFSLFVNLCNLPLVGAMLCTEYIYRQWRHPARPPERLTDMFRNFRPLRVVPLSDDRYGGP